MNTVKTEWRGSFPAIVTPFDKDFEIDERLFLENVEMTIAEGNHGIIVGGHNGEAPVMSFEERCRIVQLAVMQVRSRIPLLTGTGGIDTREVIKLTRAVKELGANGVMIEPPYYMTPQPADVIAHYQAISDQVDIPIMAYNNPRRVGVDITVDLLDRLANIKNVVAIKDSSFNFMQCLDSLARCADRIAIFMGPSFNYGLSAVVMGVSGYVDGIPQIMGRRAVDLFEASVNGDIDKAREIQWQAYQLGKVLFNAEGTFPATVKDAMNLLGRPGGLPRPPLGSMSGAALERFKAGLVECGVLMRAAAE
jgi:4-hydroxy-tetrahydrodipicolinate synthase